MASSFINYIFMTEPSDSLKCTICLEIAEDPKQCEDCGKLFCSECIEKNGKKPCPNCRTENPRFFKDKRGARDIKELGVRCSCMKRGCKWTGTIGTLDDHMSTCEFALVSCPNKCGEDGQLTIMRKNLDNHLKTTCSNRAHQCQYCGVKGTYASITEDHDKVCNKKIVPCPNKERGCPLSMEQGKTEQHVRRVCDYTEVACTYESLGCGMTMPRKDVKEHETNDREQHLTFALDTVKKQSEQQRKLEEQLRKLEERLRKLEEQNMTLAKEFVFKVPGYAKKKKNNETYSTSLYTHPGGYKMCIDVVFNGVGSCAGMYVSINTKLLKGRYDDQLHWPFMGTVTIELLNQLTDDNHWRKVGVFDASDDMQIGSTVVHYERIPHSSLLLDLFNNTRYLLDDTLYVRVSVTVDNHKPWLVCTDHTNVPLSNCDSENSDNSDHDGDTTSESDDSMILELRT